MLRRLLAWIRGWFTSEGREQQQPRQQDRQEPPRADMMQPLEEREFLSITLPGFDNAEAAAGWAVANLPEAAAQRANDAGDRAGSREDR